MNRPIFAALLILLVNSVAPAANATPATGPLAACTEHRISLSLQPAAHTASIEDQGTVICSAGQNLLYLKDSAAISSFSLDGHPAKYTFIPKGDTAQLPPDLRKALAGTEPKTGVGFLLFESASADTVPFHLAFTARFDDPVENVQFSREKVGNEVAGTILEQGAYLSPAACYFPQGAETMARFSLTAEIPASWEAIADGNPVSTETKGDRKTQRFENPFLSDGYVFMAAPYLVRTTAVDGITVATYFFEADSALCDKYLTATADYIRMYQEMIGPYPFKQFTVAENFFPTGYGMPGWTLLGQTVLRLPFIITSSLGHEVLHNWWGNSVYVDYARGNWCEAATTYGADYHYKLLTSPQAARDYRKDILKEYLSYVHAGNDFPIREFKSRSSAETRTIGYNKGMMLFHLIEQQIGSGPFFEAWKQVYKDYKGRAISWEEWIDAFQKAGQQDLAYVIPEWIDRAGAPQLGLQVSGVKPAGSDGRRIVSLKITQSAETPYHLTVPIRAEGDGVAESTTVQIAAAETAVDFSVPAGATTICVDPDFHLFRRLYPEEVEPIVSAVLGVPRKGLVALAADQTARDAFAAFGAALTEDSAKASIVDKLEAVPPDNAPLVLNPKELPVYLSKQVQVTEDSVTVAGQAYPREGHTVVLAGQNWNGFGKYLVILTNDYGSLPRLGELVPHYGKYSYLVFAGAKNIAKGQWPVTESPLQVTIP
jgi:aminopeptidase N